MNYAFGLLRMNTPPEHTTSHGYVNAGASARHVMRPEERANLRVCGIIMSPLYGLGLGVAAGVMASNAHPMVASIGIGVAVGGVSCKAIHTLFKRALRQPQSSPSMEQTAPRMR
jgi:hypothetical protein